MKSLSGDRWASFPALARTLPEETFVLMDARLPRLHPAVIDALHSVRAIYRVPAGEDAKRFSVADRILRAAIRFSRAATLLAVGGGTIGDLAAVVAHLHKRGIRLVLVPTTLLAAVDSSVGGKGALNLGAVKNAVGVFHSPSETWLCPELFSTLSETQLDEGRIESLKMMACLDVRRWAEYRRHPPTIRRLIEDSRRLKARVVREDPLDRNGARLVLNFGHTFGHVLEAVSRHRLPHGAAVRLGVVCALDVGRAMGVTPAATAGEVQSGFERLGGRPIRSQLREWLGNVPSSRVGDLLSSDKKRSQDGTIRMVLLERIGRPVVRPVEPEVWSPLLRHWRAGRAP
jgi:3-dehydroquinate synthase